MNKYIKEDEPKLTIEVLPYLCSHFRCEKGRCDVIGVYKINKKIYCHACGQKKVKKFMEIEDF